MSKENKNYDTRTRIESSPKSVIFRQLGGFKNTNEANAKANDIEAVLLQYMQVNNACIDVAYIGGQVRLVFVEKTKAEIADDLEDVVNG